MKQLVSWARGYPDVIPATWNLRPLHPHAATCRANGRGSDTIQEHSTSVANHRLADMFRSLPRSDSPGADGTCSKSVPIRKPFLNTMFAAETTSALDEHEHAFLEP
jgi:hypothetical protein